MHGQFPHRFIVVLHPGFNLLICVYKLSCLLNHFLSNLTVCNNDESHLNSAKSVRQYLCFHMRSLPYLKSVLLQMWNRCSSPSPPLSAKPISLVERCYCRSTVNSLPRGYIRELRFIQTPNCPFQVVWVRVLNAWFSVWNHQSRTFFTLALKRQTGFLLAGHFSPSISERWQAREKSCACMFTHTPLCHSLSHMPFLPPAPLTHPQEVPHLSMSERERVVEIGCSFVFGRGKSNNCGFRNWVCFPFACHAAFPPHAVLTTFRPDLIRCNTCVERTYRWKRAAVLAPYSWLQ